MAFGFLKKIGGAVGGAIGKIGNLASKTGIPVVSQIGGVASSILLRRNPGGQGSANIPVPYVGFSPPTAPSPGSLPAWISEIRAAVQTVGQTVREVGRTDPRQFVGEFRGSLRGLGSIEGLQRMLPFIAIGVVLVILLVRRK